jgi:transcriptional regulator with XRE-family HTH domain
MGAPHLRAIRTAQGLSQQGLAERAELDVTTISRVEHGASAHRYTVYKLALALGVAPNDLTGARSTEWIKTPQLHAVRKTTGLTLPQLARRAKVPRMTVIRLEAGYDGRSAIVHKLAGVLGVAPAQLMERGPVDDR